LAQRCANVTKKRTALDQLPLRTKIFFCFVLFLFFIFRFVFFSFCGGGGHFVLAKILYEFFQLKLQQQTAFGKEFSAAN